MSLAKDQPHFRVIQPMSNLHPRKEALQEGQDNSGRFGKSKERSPCKDQCRHAWLMLLLVSSQNVQDFFTTCILHVWKNPMESSARVRGEEEKELSRPFVCSPVIDVFVT